MKPKIHPHPELVKKFPAEVKILFEIFGSEIRLVGGCVRDFLLEKRVNDFDFATKFLPQEVVKILTKNKIKAVPTGVKFGTITAVVSGKNFEITTLRKDSQTDGRHCNPEFVDDYFLDAARRDFTMNALYLDFSGLVYDYFDGISDLKNKKVKFIGDAKSRIEEDFLRILRFFRFSCEYADKLDIEGLKACATQKENLKKLSRERIRAEVLKMISSAKKQNVIAVLKVLQSKKIAQEIFARSLDVKALEHLFEIEENLKTASGLNLKLAVLFVQKDFDLKFFSKEISATNLEKKYFQFLISNFSAGKNLNQKSLKNLLLCVEKNTVWDLYLFGLAKNFDQKNIPLAKKDLQFLQKFSLPNFPLKSEDLIQLGFSGKKLGEALQKSKEVWAENDFKLNKSELLDFLVKS